MKSQRAAITLTQALSERLTGSYCLRFRGGHPAKALKGMDWNNPMAEFNEQSG